MARGHSQQWRSRPGVVDRADLARMRRMTPSRIAVGLGRGAFGTGEPSGAGQGDHLILPAATGTWVSADAVRGAVGAWAYTELPEAERPGAAELRRAIGVAAGLAEVAVGNSRSPFGAGPLPTALWDVDVPADVERLGELAGCAAREALASLQLLRQCGAVVVSPERPDHVRLTAAACESAPGVASVDWASVRDALRDVGIPGNATAAPLAVVRELARAAGPVPDPLQAPQVRFSVRELEGATLFSRSTVSEALASLERAGIAVAEARRGQALRCSLTPRAFGLGGPSSRARTAVRGPLADPLAPDPVRVAPEKLPSGDLVADLSPMSPVSHAAGATVKLGEFAGTPIYGPSGTPIVLECDEQGQWTCRVGPHLRLGPVA